MGLFGLLLVLRLAGDRIGEDSAWADVDKAPLGFTGHWIHVAAAQEAHVVGALELLDGGRILFEFPEVKLDGALILLAALDQQLFFVTLGLERDAGQCNVKRQRYGSSHGEDQKQRKTGFRRASPPRSGVPTRRASPSDRSVSHSSSLPLFGSGVPGLIAVT